MDCGEFRKMISRRIDGAIESDGCPELDRHLDSCARCRRFAELSLAGLAIHRSMTEVDPPRFMVSSIMAAVEARPGTEWRRGWLRFAVPAAAAAAAVLGVWIGGLIRESYAPKSVESRADILELKYLDEFPPGSFGDIMMASNEGGGDGQR
ncbi:MAG: zf-HC2 domain-containing protein [Candidatus Krumholzibacteriaceae bacterium]|jgi:anti-sigma factor RsiW